MTDIIKGSEFTTVEDFDPKVKAKAYELYLTTDMSLIDIAMDLEISSKVVGTWSKKGGWRQRKEEATAELFKSAEDKYRQVIAQKRVPVIERHLRVSEKIEKGIEKVVDEMVKDDKVPNAMNIKRMAESMSAISGVDARAAGISDKPFSDAEQDESKKRQPLIIIHAPASASPDGREPLVKVTEMPDESESVDHQ